MQDQDQDQDKDGRTQTAIRLQGRSKTRSFFAFVLRQASGSGSGSSSPLPCNLAATHQLAAAAASARGLHLHSTRHRPSAPTSAVSSSEPCVPVDLTPSGPLASSTPACGPSHRQAGTHAPRLAQRKKARRARRSCDHEHASGITPGPRTQNPGGMRDRSARSPMPSYDMCSGWWWIEATKKPLPAPLVACGAGGAPPPRS